MTKRKYIDTKTIAALVDAFNGKCSYCGVKTLGVDHFIPLSKGGSSEINNLVLCCQECNSKAGSRVFRSLEDKRIYILSKYLVSSYNKVRAFEMDKKERNARAKLLEIARSYESDNSPMYTSVMCIIKASRD